MPNIAKPRSDEAPSLAGLPGKTSDGGSGTWVLAATILGKNMFDGTLDQRLDSLRVTAPVREQIDRQRPKLAAIETKDEGAREAIQLSFVAGFRGVAWIGAILGIGSAVVAAGMIDDKQHER